jgi:hypothetical protein
MKIKKKKSENVSAGMSLCVYRLHIHPSPVPVFKSVGAFLTLAKCVDVAYY